MANHVGDQLVDDDAEAVHDRPRRVVPAADCLDHVDEGAELIEPGRKLNGELIARQGGRNGAGAATHGRHRLHENTRGSYKTDRSESAGRGLCARSI